MRYTLIHPLVDNVGGEDVVRLEVIDFRLPTARDVKQTKGLTASIDLTCRYIELLGGVPKDLVDRLHIADLTVLDKITDAFFDAPEAQAAKRADAWLKAQGLPGLTSATPGARSE